MAGYPTSPEGAEFAILGVDVMIPGFDDVPSSRASGEPTGTGLVLIDISLPTPGTGRIPALGGVSGSPLAEALTDVPAV